MLFSTHVNRVSVYFMLALLMEMGPLKNREKLRPGGIEPTTFGLDHHCSTD